MPLLRRIRTFDTLTIGREGEEPIVVQLRRVTTSEVRLCVIAPDEFDVVQASHGTVVKDTDHG